MLDNTSIAIVYFPGFDAIKFEINLAFWSSRFPTWPKKSGQKGASATLSLGQIYIVETSWTSEKK